MVHDINYLIATGSHEGMDLADDKAIRRADYSLQGIAMQLGLKFRKLTHLKESENADRVNELYNLGLMLKHRVLNDDAYAEMRTLYNIAKGDFLK